MDKKKKKDLCHFREISTGTAVMADHCGRRNSQLTVLMKGVQIYLVNHFILRQSGCLSFLILSCDYVRI